jgi:hypothetical protein
MIRILDSRSRADSRCKSGLKRKLLLWVEESILTLLLAGHRDKEQEIWLCTDTREQKNFKSRLAETKNVVNMRIVW